MAYEPILPVTLEVERGVPVPQSRFLRDRWTGILHLRWTIDPAHPVAVGAGRLGLHSPSRARPAELIAEIVRRGADRLPVIPGSSIKGAVRQVYEIFTPSCRLDPACSVQHGVCPACSLFGAAGLAGRVAFGEAEPAVAAGGRPPLPIAEKVPVARLPRIAREGTVRFYDSRPMKTREGDDAPCVEWTWAVAGTFRSSLRLWNASRREIGLLLVALGVGARGPSLRVGGKKFHGLGAARIAVEKAERLHGELPLPSPLFSLVQEMFRDSTGESLKEPTRVWNELHFCLEREA